MNLLEELVDLLILEQISPPKEIIVYCDLDGVMANFDGKVESNSKLLAARQELAMWLKQKPELLNIHKDELKTLLRGPQEDPYMKRLKRLLNNANELVYMTAGKPGFFLSLDVMPGSLDMLLAAMKLTGKRSNILTAPMESSKNCEEEKRAWVEKNLAGLFDKFICTQEKDKWAKSKYDILIDDRPKYINKFRAAGGTAILHTDPQKTIKELTSIIENLKSGKSVDESRELDEFNAMGTGAVYLPL